MAFFGGNDPFFGGDIHRMMRSQMRDMEALFNDPFGMMNGGGRVLVNGRYQNPRQQMIDDQGRNPGSNWQNQNPATIYQQQQPAQRQSMMQPFGFGFGGGLFGGLMSQMEQIQSDPNAHVYSQSTVISMTPGRDGRPKYYEATESVRKAGDVKETRRSVKDTSRGVEKMEIGHHIGNRGHVIEKKRDRTTGGRIMENQEFIGLKEDEAEQFDNEWSHATRGALSGERFLNSNVQVNPHLAIGGSSRSQRRNHNASPYKRSPASQNRRTSHQSKTSSVRVEEPAEEESDQRPNKEKDGRKSGPVIVELE